MLIVYRISDKEILFNSGKSYIEPEGPSDINGKLAVIERFGGKLDDYGIFRLHDVKNEEKVDSVLNAHEYQLVFDEVDNPIDVKIIKTKEEWLLENPPRPPEEEVIKQELGKILFENARDKARIKELENITASLLLEIASLKAGGKA